MNLPHQDLLLARRDQVSHNAQHQKRRQGKDKPVPPGPGSEKPDPGLLDTLAPAHGSPHRDPEEDQIFQDEVESGTAPFPDIEE